MKIVLSLMKSKNHNILRHFFQNHNAFNPQEPSMEPATMAGNKLLALLGEVSKQQVSPSIDLFQLQVVAVSCYFPLK